MKEKNIPTDDLYALILPRQKELQIKGNVHFLKEGYQVMAGQVAASIKDALSIN